ncbi:MAG: methyltransferase domain-containing protein [Gemmatimonadales bacterium]|nr:MAG: methyltransferase domain-containing protein [Gemmatimonadales bacterium]
MNALKQRASARWDRLSRHRFTRTKISRKNIQRLTREYASTERTLIIHPEEGLEDFPNHFIVSKRPEDRPDLLVDSQFHGLSAIESESYPIIVCCGLLEHIAEPQRFIDELHRILQPGGKLIVSCSACFSFHECPEDFFHYTPYGLKLLFEKWSGFELLRGSSGPFETIGILLQRIHIQCDISPPLRPILELMFHTIPHLDRFVIRQYETVQVRDETSEIDSMMPSNLQAVIVK